MAAHSRQRTAAKVFRITLRSDPKSVHRVEEFLIRMNSSLHLDEEKLGSLLVVVTEAVNNAIIHGNKRDPAKKVIVTGTRKGHALTIRVKDEGKGFDPSAIPNPVHEDNLLRESGRGVFLMHQLMEKVSFNAHGNEVTMTMTI
ncbi:MAG TPA: ATP-binding protein [Bacteroidota bacterium]|nr:ATP-binding protein [Bacteroidota bacterium]